MAAHGPTETGFPPPGPDRSTWPAPAAPAQTAAPSSQGSRPWLSVLALLFAVVGIVGALLPAMDGQKVGDPDSVAFRLGVPMGFLGGLLAATLGAIALGRSNDSVPPKVVSIVSIAAGGVALLLTASLIFSG